MYRVLQNSRNADRIQVVRHSFAPRVTRTLARGATQRKTLLFHFGRLQGNGKNGQTSRGRFQVIRMHLAGSDNSHVIIRCTLERMTDETEEKRRKRSRLGASDLRERVDRSTRRACRNAGGKSSPRVVIASPQNTLTFVSECIGACSTHLKRGTPRWAEALARNASLLRPAAFVFPSQTGIRRLRPNN
jgi:hypothetical protein